MASVNKVILIGNLGADPELRYTPSGDAACNLSIATSEAWTDKSGEKQEHVEWHRVSVFKRMAEVAGEYLKKGSPVYIEGKIRTKAYEKDGVKKYSTEIIADRMQLLGSRPAGGGTPAERPERPPVKQSSQQPAKKGGGFEDMDDDIPF